MSKDRRVPRRRPTGDAQHYVPSKVPDAQDVLFTLATKARDIRVQRARAPRNRDGQGTNYAGFGDQYFRLKSSLVRIVKATHVKVKGRIVRAERTPEDVERLKLLREADAFLKEREDD